MLFGQKFLIKATANCNNGAIVAFKCPIETRFMTWTKIQEMLRERVEFELGKKVDSVRIIDSN